MSDMANIQLGGNQYPPLGKGEYDAIIFGLGFRECLVASLLIKAKKRVWIVINLLLVGTDYFEKAVF